MTELRGDPAALVREAQSQENPVATVALVSGGNDSITLLHAVRDVVDFAFHIDTGTGVPETTEFVRSTCASWGVPLRVGVTPPAVFDALILDPDSLYRERTGREPGFLPYSGHQVAFYYLKQKRLRELRGSLLKGHPRSARVLFVTGVRSSESSRRRKSAMAVPLRREGRIIWVNPILDWTSTDLNQYRAENDVPRNPVADILHKSGECLCGAMARHEEMDELRLWYPDVAARFDRLSAELRSRGCARTEWGNRAAPTRPLGEAGPLCTSCDARAGYPEGETE